MFSVSWVRLMLTVVVPACTWAQDSVRASVLIPYGASPWDETGALLQLNLGARTYSGQARSQRGWADPDLPTG
jgi:hypothetical protein